MPKGANIRTKDIKTRKYIKTKSHREKNKEYSKKKKDKTTFT